MKLLSRVRILRLHGLQPARLLYLWDSPGKNTGGGSHFLLEGIFPTQESNLGLPYCRQTIYRLSHQGSPDLTECLAILFVKSGIPAPRVSGSISRREKLQGSSKTTLLCDSGDVTSPLCFRVPVSGGSSPELPCPGLEKPV